MAPDAFLLGVKNNRIREPVRPVGLLVKEPDFESVPASRIRIAQMNVVSGPGPAFALETFELLNQVSNLRGRKEDVEGYDRACLALAAPCGPGF